MKALQKKTQEYHEKNKVNKTSSPPPGPPPAKPNRIAVINSFCGNKHPTLGVALFCNPYDWLEGNVIYLNRIEFLTKTCERVET